MQQRRGSKWWQRPESFHDVQDLSHGDTAGRRRRHRVDAVPAIADLDRIAPDGAVRCEVLVSDESATPGHLGHEEIGDPASIKAGSAAVSDSFERGTQLGLIEDRPHNRWPPVGQERRARGGEPGQARAVSTNGTAPVLVDLESFIREADGRTNHSRERQPSKPAMRFSQTSNSPGYAGRQMASEARVLTSVPVH